MSSTLRNNTAQSRYEMDEQGMTSWADYRLSGDRLFIDHVEAPPALRGTGASGRLMAALARPAGVVRSSKRICDRGLFPMPGALWSPSAAPSSTGALPSH